MNERAPIAGPYHGTRSFGSTVRAMGDEPSTVLAPAIEQLVGGEIAALFVGDIGAPLRSSVRGVDPERVRVGERHQRPLVEEPEVGDLVADRPAGGRGRRSPDRHRRRPDRGRRARRSARHTACPRRTICHRQRAASASGPDRAADADRQVAIRPSWRRLLGRRLLGDGLLRRRLGGGALATAFLAGAFAATAFLAGAFLAGALAHGLLGRRLLGRRLLGRRLATASWREPSSPAPSWRAPWQRRLLRRSLRGDRLLGRRLGAAPSWREPSSRRLRRSLLHGPWVTSFFFGLSVVLSVELGVNFIAVEAAIFTGAPVCGLRPVRAARLVVAERTEARPRDLVAPSSPWSRGRRTHRSCAQRPPWRRPPTSRPHR